MTTHDATVSLASATIEATPSQAQSSVLQAGPRPSAERWVGKNWACSRAMESVETDWVLFIDADVELAPQTLRRALAQANAEEADLFSLAPSWCAAAWRSGWCNRSWPACSASATWRKPTRLPSGIRSRSVHPVSSPTYSAIGGHQALADEVVEDLALARRIKGSGYRLRYCLGLVRWICRCTPISARCGKAGAKTGFWGWTAVSPSLGGRRRGVADVRRPVADRSFQRQRVVADQHQASARTSARGQPPLCWESSASDCSSCGKFANALPHLSPTGG